MTAESSILLRLRLRYPRAARDALNIDAELPGRGIIAVYGPSGAGKTSLLRCIAGLERAEGELRIGDQVWQDGRRRLPTHRRALGYVFQEASLFPHLTAAANLRYAERRAGADPALRGDILRLMGLDGLLARYPHQLSGGERQRVAISRALLSRPRLLLMDEPLAALDSARRREILPYLDALHRNLDLPILYVTHSLDEVARLADTVLVLESGRAIAQGPAAQLLPQLTDAGDEQTGVLIEAVVAERDARWGLARLRFAGGDLWAPDGGEATAQPLRLRVLARDVSLSQDERCRSSILNRLPARIEEIEQDDGAAQALVRLRVGDTPLLARITRRSASELALTPGQQVWAQIKSVAVVR